MTAEEKLVAGAAAFCLLLAAAALFRSGYQMSRWEVWNGAKPVERSVTIKDAK